MFSPMVAIASAIAASTVIWPTFAALIFSMSEPTSSATWPIILTRPWNCSLRATKSVSELTSTTTPLVPLVTAEISPSAATRPAFFAAFDRPFLRSQSCAAVMSPPVSVSAVLQSIMPAPVDSRRSLTIAAVIVAIRSVLLPVRADGGAALAFARACHQVLGVINEREGRGPAFADLLGFRSECPGLGDPGVGAARKPNLFADLVGGLVIKLGELPIMEDAEIVEFLLDRTGDARQLLEIV